MRTNLDMKECPFCGEEIKKEAVKCRYCKSWLSDTHKTQTKPIAITQNNPCQKRQEKGFLKISAIWMLVISFITSGLFIPYWLDRTIKTINKKLKGKYQISGLNVVISLVLILILIVITSISNYYSELGDQYMNDLLFNYTIDGDSLDALKSVYPEDLLDKCILWLRMKSAFQLIVLLFNWHIAFRIKKGLELIYKEKFSGILTFLLNFYYIQFKVNTHYQQQEALLVVPLMVRIIHNLGKISDCKSLKEFIDAKIIDKTPDPTKSTYNFLESKQFVGQKHYAFEYDLANSGKAHLSVDFLPQDGHDYLQERLKSMANKESRSVPMYLANINIQLLPGGLSSYLKVNGTFRQVLQNLQEHFGIANNTKALVKLSKELGKQNHSSVKLWELEIEDTDYLLMVSKFEGSFSVNPYVSIALFDRSI